MYSCMHNTNNDNDNNMFYYFGYYYCGGFETDPKKRAGVGDKLINTKYTYYTDY